MARHNREGQGEDQHGRRYLIGYQPDWFHQVKVARGLDTGRQSTKILLRNPALMGPAGRAASALPGGHVEGFGDTFGALFRAIYADIIAGRPALAPPYATFADGHDEMLVNDAIAASGASGRWTDVDRGLSPASSPSTAGLAGEEVSAR